MEIHVSNHNTGETISLDTDHITGVIKHDNSTLKVFLNNMNYIVHNHPVLMPMIKQKVQLEIFGFDEPRIDRGEVNKQKGIKKAVDHANIKSAGRWADMAYLATKSYIETKRTGFSFMMEDVRMWAEENQILPDPPSKRAWGGIPLRLVKERLIYKSGFGIVKNENANKCYASVWTKL